MNGDTLIDEDVRKKADNDVHMKEEPLEGGI
jgi:hypothetical protein